MTCGCRHLVEACDCRPLVWTCGCVSVQTKHIQTTIKCIGFELIHYAINVDDVSSFMVFSEFDYMFLIIYC